MLLALFECFIKFSEKCARRDWSERVHFYFFLSLRAGGIIQILQSDWFLERVVFYDLKLNSKDSRCK